MRAVEGAVLKVIEAERTERRRLLEEDRIGIADVVLRSFGILTNCVRLTMREFMRYMANVKLGVTLGLLSGSLEELDGLIVDMRPSNIDQINGSPLEEATIPSAPPMWATSCAAWGSSPKRGGAAFLTRADTLY